MRKASALAWAMAVWMAAPCAMADQGPSGASERVSLGAASILAAPLASVDGASGGGSPVDGSTLLAAGGSFVVLGVIQAGTETVEVLFQSAASASRFTARISSKTARAAKLSAGVAIEAVEVSAGVALVASGQVLALLASGPGADALAQERLSR